LSARSIHSQKRKVSFQTFTQTFVPPNFPNETFVPSNVKFPQNVSFPQFHFSSSSLNQNPNSPNFTSLQFHWIKILIPPISLFNIEEPISLVPNSFPILQLDPGAFFFFFFFVCLHFAFGGYLYFWNRNGVFLFRFGLVLVWLLMDPWSEFAMDFGLRCWFWLFCMCCCIR